MRLYVLSYIRILLIVALITANLCIIALLYLRCSPSLKLFRCGMALRHLLARRLCDHHSCTHAVTHVLTLLQSSVPCLVRTSAMQCMGRWRGSTASSAHFADLSVCNTIMLQLLKHSTSNAVGENFER